MAQRITGHTELLSVIATPIRHSLSPMMHNTAFEALGLDYVYVAFDFPPENLAAAVCGLKALKVKGFNISMPYKADVIRYLDGVDRSVELIGACNTVVRGEDGGYYGYNTDGIGYMTGLRDAGYDPVGKKMTVLGSGGAATAIMMQAALDGVSEISVFNRTGGSFARAEANVRLINEQTACRASVYPMEDHEALRRELDESYVLTNATNVGMGKLEGQCLIPNGSFLRPELIVTDAIYQPRETALLKLARECGCRTLNGLPMILFQGAEAFRLWTGEEMPVETVKQVLFGDT